MAIPDYSDYSAASVEASAGSGNEGQESSFAVPATDYFSGAAFAAGSTFVGRSAICVRAQLVTSNDGSERVSRNTSEEIPGTLCVVSASDSERGEGPPEHLPNSVDRGLADSERNGMRGLPIFPSLPLNSYHDDSWSAVGCQETDSREGDNDLHHNGAQTAIASFSERRDESSGYVSGSISASSNRHEVLPCSVATLHAISMCSGTQIPAFFQSFASYDSRIATFPDEFLLDHVAVNKNLLAMAGFFYSGHGTVTCFHCGCSPRVWRDGQDPLTEHRVLSPYCRALPPPY